MSALVSPSVEYHRSFVSSLREFHAEEHNLDIDADLLDSPDAFAVYIAELHAAALPDTPRPENWVPGTNLWYVDGVEHLGTLQIRHSLTPLLRTMGGHIGYEVRPSARRQGHARRMLALALPIAHGLGIDPALVTCDATNVASRKVIEANGGRQDTPIGPKLRYWLATS